MTVKCINKSSINKIIQEFLLGLLYKKYQENQYNKHLTILNLYIYKGQNKIIIQYF